MSDIFEDDDNEEFDDGQFDPVTVTPLFGDDEMDVVFDPAKFDAECVPIIVLRHLVMFPGVTIPVNLNQGKTLRTIHEAVKNHQYVGVLTKRINEADPESYYPVGVLCEVVKEIETPDGSHSFVLHGRKPFRVERYVSTSPAVIAAGTTIDETMLTLGTRTTVALMHELRDTVRHIEECPDNPIGSDVMFVLSNVKDYNLQLAFLCYMLPMSLEHRHGLLCETDYLVRARSLAKLMSSCLAYTLVKKRMHEMTHFELNDMQKQQYLRTQIRTIQEQLGESTQADIDMLLKTSQDKHWPLSVMIAFKKEVDKLQKISDQSPEYYVQYNYLQTLVALPWGKLSRDNMNLSHARRVLDRDHYGLKDVKERILEHLAVLKLRGDMKSPILCLVGPPGVGKTSLGRSIAMAMDRKYVRVSLGGLHDEAEIRGHRRTYIGAMPGRIISGILKAYSDNPVFVLDEIDKISADYKGDPSTALLEVLDPEQNKAYHDNYLDVDYDLSKVFFIATANSLSTISAPLRDRMEIIDLSGYCIEEKVEIGERHLLPKQKAEHGLNDIDFSIPRRTIEQIIENYTRESGVRLLDKTLAKIMRKVAWRVANQLPVPSRLQLKDIEDFLGKPEYNPEKYEGNEYYGVVTGLAWTSVGGCILEVESALVPGKGGLTLTGSLGDVMKESAQLALLWVKANADKLGIDAEVFEKHTAHIHCPEGATPKDGPSAGITMVTSLVSTFTKRRVRPRIAMTGEITLRGKVLPIGGVKEKILAAKRAGITDVILCCDNRKDVEEIDAQYTRGLTFHYVHDMHEVLGLALE